MPFYCAPRSVLRAPCPTGLSRYVYEVAEDELRFLIQNSPDGKDWMTFLEGVYRPV